MPGIPKRPSKTKRADWYAFDHTAFRSDPRMKTLTPREKSFWRSMLDESFPEGGKMSADPAVVAGITGASQAEAKVLLTKLFSTGLLVATPKDDKLFDAVSNRMALEHVIAMGKSQHMSNLGNISAEKNGTANLRVVK